MKRILIIAGLLLAVCAVGDRRGQLMQQRQLTTTSFVDPSGSNTLYAWWVASDLAGTGNLVNNTNPWIDRIKAIKLQNTSTSGAGSGPTNGATGLDFRGGRALTNAPLAAGTNSTVCLILKPHTIGSPFQRYIYGPYDDSDATQAVTPGCVVLHNASSAFHWGGFNAAGGGDISGARASDVTCDLIINQSNLVFYALTNGLSSGTRSVTPPAGGWPWQYLGYDTISAVDMYDGIIMEVLVWTNAFSSVQVSNVHYYATNTYSFSP